ncbi:PilC/PilY family type IV pilus protein [Thiorhodococcus fuscus]|uniref:PilC/PilY family type IV pilus protein n=1 Tax=Thiorhodococcus fuscus TaxID=527200 RepID=A0ABW4Y5D1_9GAMM
MPSDRYLSQSSWKLEKADSYQNSNRPSAAFDGDPSTFWHTQWSPNSPKHPHYIIIDLGKTETIKGFEYVPRPSGENGTIGNYEFYVSSSSSLPNASALAASGSFSYGTTGDTQEVIFDTAKSGRYIMLRALSEVNGNAWTSVAELRLIQNTGPAYYFAPNGEVSNGSCGGSKWSGNFLNWATMTAIDEFIHTMTGGNRIYDSKTQVIVERARKQSNDSWFPYKKITSHLNDVTPYSSNTGALWIYNSAYGFNISTKSDSAAAASGTGYIGSFNVKVEVCNQTEGVESNCTKYTDGSGIWYKPEGLMQRNMQRMRFGIMAYSNDNDQNRDGGVLRAPMKYIGPTLPSGEVNPDKEYTLEGAYIDNPEGYSGGNSGVLNYLNMFHKAGYKQYDPVSELFYECLNYYKHRGPTRTFYENLTNTEKGGFPVYTDSNSWKDPILYWCQTNYIIGLNDANPWLDKKLPGTWFASGSNWCDRPSAGVGDCGLPSNPDPDINVTSLTNKVGAFESRGKIGEDLASGAGGRYNSNYIAGLAYYANTNDIRDTLKGTQTVTTFMIDSQEYSSSPTLGNKNVLWLAGKYGGFVDANGDNEPQQGEWDSDSDGEPDNYVLATSPTKMVNALEKAFSVATAGLKSSQAAASVGLNTRTGLGAVYQSAYVTSYQDTTTAANRVEWIGEIKMAPINADASIGSVAWNALDVLKSVDQPTQNRTWDSADARKRYVFTWLDEDLDGAVDTGEQIILDSSAVDSDTYPFFDLVSVSDKTNTTAMSAALTTVTELVDFIRGDTTGANVRNRTADFDGNGVTERLLLGDIVHSQPVAVGKPSEDFDLLYDDVTYAGFKVQYKNRRTVVYVGANDGMLHAFNAGYYDGSSYSTSGSGAAHALGAELWAYVPFNLLPHLKWLESTAYDHTYYMDGPIKAFDAKIFTEDADHPDGWGTVLVAGMRLGGSPMTVDTGDDGFGDSDPSDDHEFASAWVLLDVTNPEKPATVLAEIKDPNSPFATGMGYSFSEPAVFTIRENDDSPNDWYLVFGNGPNSLATVNSDQPAKLYVYKLNENDRGFVDDYDPLVLSPNHTGFVGAVTSVDWNLNYKADTLYFGTTGSGTGAGRFFKIELGEDTDPSNWELTEIINLGAPVSMKPTVTVDNQNKHWVYFGSGRLETDSDTSLTQQEYILGIRDEAGDEYPISLSDLKDVTDIVVYSNGSVENAYENGNSIGTLSALDAVINTSLQPDGTHKYFGWYRKLDKDTTDPSERNLSRHSLLGGALITTTYQPDLDLCTLGVSYLYALYYRTGTAYSNSNATGGFLGYGSAGTNGKSAAHVRVEIAQGIAMSPALHIGEVTEKNTATDQVTAVVQDSNANIHTQTLETERALESGEISWREIGTSY